MATETTHVEFFIPASAQEIYRSWLHSDGHEKMTGAKASITPEVGAMFSAWGGYIQGSNVALQPGKQIVQLWRTADFSPDDADSRVEITFSSQEGGTLIQIAHSEIPPGQGLKYEQGWKVHYIEPMMAYFSGEDDE